jgi:hypothetical protein
VSVTIRPAIVDDVELAILDALFRQRMQEVCQSPPELVDVFEMIAVISAAATRERDKVSKGETPDEREAVELCLQAVLKFLMKQPRLMERGDIAPLLRLNAALCDLSIGKTSDLLKPAKKLKSGSPGDGITHKFIKAIAARALSEFIEAGENNKQAARRIARALKVGRRGMGNRRGMLTPGYSSFPRCRKFSSRLSCPDADRGGMSA